MFDTYDKTLKYFDLPLEKPTKETRTKIKKSDFRRWLKSKKPNAVVGKTRDYSCCPIAKFIRQTFPTAKNIAVNKSDVYFSLGKNPTRFKHTRKWQERFTYFVDDYYGQSRPITAEECIYLLDISST